MGWGGVGSTATRVAYMTAGTLPPALPDTYCNTWETERVSAISWRLAFCLVHCLRKQNSKSICDFLASRLRRVWRPERLAEGGLRRDRRRPLIFLILTASKMSLVFLFRNCKILNSKLKSKGGGGHFGGPPASLPGRGQTRPDQARPGQTRPGGQARPGQTRRQRIPHQHCK